MQVITFKKFKNIRPLSSVQMGDISTPVRRNFLKQQIQNQNFQRLKQTKKNILDIKFKLNFLYFSQMIFIIIYLIRINLIQFLIYIFYIILLLKLPIYIYIKMQQTSNHTMSFVSNYELPHVNKNNLHSYSPYLFDYDKNHYVVDKEWFTNLTESTQKQLQTKFNVGQIRNIGYPHEVNKAYQYWEIYTWYNCDVYDFQKYVSDVSEINNEQIHLIKFKDNKEKNQFSELFFKEHPKIQTMERINMDIQQILSSSKTEKGYFVKLTQRSGKNEIKLFPAKTVDDVYKNLIYSMDVKKEIDQSSGILLREWKIFEDSVQFRVFIFNRRILGVSPQFYQHKLDWRKINFEKLITELHKGIQKIKFANSFMIDVMFVNNQRLWFLEFNPYGVYAASRSALFTHEQILKLEKQNQLPIVKVLKN